MQNEPKYISLLTDFGFKKIFKNRQHPNILIDFIESVFPELEIASVQFEDTDQSPEEKAARGSAFDVYCTLSNGELVIVELQNAKQAFFKDRSIYYSSIAIKDQGIKGNWNYELPPVYVISVINFRITTEDKELKHFVHLMSAQTKKIFYNKLTFVYLQLPNLSQKWIELGSNLEEWLFLIRNPHREKKVDMISNEKKKRPVISEAMSLAEYRELSTGEKLRYERERYRESDIRNVREYAVKEAREKALKEGREEGLKQGKEEGLILGIQEGIAQGIEKGIKKGIQEGIQEGAHQKALETAKKMLAKNYPLEVIADLLEISLEELTQLQDQ